MLKKGVKGGKAYEWRRSEEADGGGLRKPAVASATKGESKSKIALQNNSDVIIDTIKVL